MYPVWGNIFGCRSEAQSNLPSFASVVHGMRIHRNASRQHPEKIPGRIEHPLRVAVERLESNDIVLRFHENFNGTHFPVEAGKRRPDATSLVARRILLKHLHCLEEEET
jgi:hypothetical protein